MALFQDNQPLLNRLRILGALFVACLLLLLAQVWNLSILQGEKYAKLAENNRLRNVKLAAPRGHVVDREGRTLATNARSSKLLVFPDDLSDNNEEIAFIAEGLEMAPEEIAQLLIKAERRGPFQPVVIRSHLTHRQAAFFLARQRDYTAVRISREPRRVYPHGPLAAHLLGYVGEVTEAQLKKEEYSYKEPGDIVGKTGLEESYDRHLSGTDGRLSLIVDSRGKTIQEVAHVEPVQGLALSLTLDLDLQRTAEEANH